MKKYLVEIVESGKLADKIGDKYEIVTCKELIVGQRYIREREMRIIKVLEVLPYSN